MKTAILIAMKHLETAMRRNLQISPSEVAKGMPEIRSSPEERVDRGAKVRNHWKVATKRRNHRKMNLAMKLWI